MARMTMASTRTSGRKAGGARTDAPERGDRRAGALDRLLGDALIAAMVMLGLVFCIGAARAEGGAPGAPAAPQALQRNV